MNPPIKRQPDEAVLRQRGEASARHMRSEALQDDRLLTPEESKRVLYELRVHQIELEMQNETLRAQQIELETSRDRYIDLYDFAPVGYLTLDAHGLIEALNLTAAQLLGMERKDLLLRRFSAQIIAEDQPLWLTLFLTVMKRGGKSHVKLAMQRGDGTVFPALLDCATQTVGADSTALRIAMSDISAQKNAELDLQKSSQALQETYRKLTADHRNLMELKAQSDRMHRQLLQAEKMSSVGHLAAGVAHEINNPVGFVSSNLNTLSNYIDDLMRFVDLGAATPPGRTLQAQLDLESIRNDLPGLLAESRSGLERIRKIVAALKDFSHVGETEWQSADLLAGLESTLNVAWHALKYKTEIVRELTPLPHVFCDPAQINQVFLNLLVNAAQSIATNGTNGTITLRSGVDAAGTMVWIEIADTGCGMDEETRQHLFDPFFTTKPVGEGTGLGLSISWDIMQLHNGTIDVTSAPGAGSCFRLTLPVTGPAPKEIPA